MDLGDTLVWSLVYNSGEDMSQGYGVISKRKVIASSVSGKEIISTTENTE